MWHICPLLITIGNCYTFLLSLSTNQKTIQQSDGIAQMRDIHPIRNASYNNNLFDGSSIFTG